MANITRWLWLWLMVNGLMVASVSAWRLSPCGPGCGWWWHSLAVAPPVTLGVSSPSCRAWKHSKASWPALCRWAPKQHAANTEGSESPSSGVFSTMDSVWRSPAILKMICLIRYHKPLHFTFKVVRLSFYFCSARLFIISNWLHPIDFQYVFKASHSIVFKDIPTWWHCLPAKHGQLVLWSSWSAGCTGRKGWGECGCSWGGGQADGWTTVGK